MSSFLSRLLAPALVCCGLPLAVVAADDAAKIKGFAPVSVSSANYRNTDRGDLIRAIEGERAATNPDTPALRPAASPQHYVFMPGEISDSDLTFEEVTALLTTALAKRNYVNAADAQGIIRDPAKVTLVLRVHFGTRPWRLPTVRTDDLTWSDGMEPRAKGRGLQTLGGDRVWERRAGGNDEAYSTLSENSANPNSFSIGGGRSSAGAASTQGTLQPGAGSQGAVGLSEYGSTRDFHLIVVDAFDYQELKKDGKAARRLWTTFVSAPKESKQRFSDLAATLIRNATPYFGETTRGLQVYSDTRAEVKIGEMIEVKEPAKAP